MCLCGWALLLGWKLNAFANSITWTNHRRLLQHNCICHCYPREWLDVYVLCEELRCAHIIIFTILINDEFHVAFALDHGDNQLLAFFCQPLRLQVSITEIRSIVWLVRLYCKIAIGEKPMHDWSFGTNSLKPLLSRQYTLCYSKYAG